MQRITDDQIRQEQRELGVAFDQVAKSSIEITQKINHILGARDDSERVVNPSLNIHQ